MTDDNDNDNDNDNDSDNVLVEFGSLADQTAPVGFASHVEDKIRRRSGGRFFGSDHGKQRWAAVLAVAVAAIAGLTYWLVRDDAFSTGAEDEAPEITPAAREVMPKP